MVVEVSRNARCIERFSSFIIELGRAHAARPLQGFLRQYGQGGSALTA